MSLLSKLKQVKVTIFAPDGSVRAEPLALISEDMIRTEDVSIHLEPGDEIRRPLPNGRDEVFDVLDVRYSEGLRTIPPSFMIKVARKGALTHKPPQAITVNGPNARVTFGHDASTNISYQGDLVQQVVDAVEAQVSDPESRAVLVSALQELGSARESASRLAAYQKLVANAANHMTILAPFLPALTGLLG